MRPLLGNDDWDSGKLFKLSRFYTVASLVAILIAGVLFILFIRKVAVQDIIELSERSNLTLAQTALNGVKPELLRFLATVEDINPGSPVNVKPPEEFTSVVEKMLQDTSVVRIKLYNHLGTVVFSTQYDQIGEDQEDNGGFQSAIRGRVRSILIYRDTFNSFDRVTEDDNLISTYIPIRSSLTETLPGVFEIYTNATSLVSRNERTEFVIALGVGLILGFLYIMLLLIVRHAAKVVDLQQQTIYERTATLGMLAARMQTLEECDKKKIAVELHEGLAQTLCSLKMVLTSSLFDLPKSSKAIGALDNVIPVLQSAIQEVQDIAQTLRPSSLDSFGLLPTIDWVLGNFECANPDIHIEHGMSLREDDIPASLKIVIFRIIKTMLTMIASTANSGRIQVDLCLVGERIVLEITDNSRRSVGSSLIPINEPNLKGRFAKIHGQTTLSGGTFSIGVYDVDGVRIKAVWPLSAYIDTSLNDECTDRWNVA